MNTALLTIKDLNREACALILESPDTYATSLAVILHSLVGEDFCEADPIELYQALEDEFGIRVPEELENKINAWITAATTPAFFHDVAGFRAVVRTFAIGFPDDPADEALDPKMAELSVSDIRWAMYEVSLAYAEVPEYSKEVRSFFFHELEGEVSEDGLLDVVQISDEEVEENRKELQAQLHAIGAGHVALP